MKLLLDTHTLLWFANGDRQMSTAATALLIDPTNDLFLSMATAWELAIKIGLKKLAVTSSYSNFLTQAINGYGFSVLAVSIDDCIAYEQLPFPDPKHKDPFDRMIVVHAQRNGLSLVGVDTAFDAYGVTRLW